MQTFRATFKNFSSNVGDLTAAAGFLEERYRAPVLLLGHSLGGAAVLQAAGAIDACRAVVTIAAPADPQHLAGLLAAKAPGIESASEARVAIGGRTFRIKKQLLDDLARHPLEERLADLGRALLILHSPADQVVDIDNAGALFRAARHPKSFVSLDRADHLLSDEEDGRYAGALAACWARPYIGVSAPERR